MENAPIFFFLFFFILTSLHVGSFQKSRSLPCCCVRRPEMKAVLCTAVDSPGCLLCIPSAGSGGVPASFPPTGAVQLLLLPDAHRAQHHPALAALQPWGFHLQPLWVFSSQPSPIPAGSSAGRPDPGKHSSELHQGGKLSLLLCLSVVYPVCFHSWWQQRPPAAAFPHRVGVVPCWGPHSISAVQSEPRGRAVGPSLFVGKEMGTTGVAESWSHVLSLLPHSERLRVPSSP